MDLNKLDKELWTTGGGVVKMYTIPFQSRMTIVRLNSGKLWLHSPVKLTKEQINSINSLGEVAYIVAPNTLHHLFIEPCLLTFPNAKLYGAEGLPEKCKALEFNGVLKETPDSGWENDIDQAYFRGSNFLNEVVFLHKKSRTLIVTDLIQNHDPKDNNSFWRLCKKLGGVLAPHGGVPRDLQLTIRDKNKARCSLEKILSWDFDRLIISHGLCIDKNAKQYVTDAFSWL